MQSLQWKTSTSLHGFKLKKKINQGAVSDTSAQSGTSQDGILKSNVTICYENIACISKKISTQVISMCVVPVWHWIKTFKFVFLSMVMLQQSISSKFWNFECFLKWVCSIFLFLKMVLVYWHCIKTRKLVFLSLVMP